MAVNNLVKSLQKIMRKDPGVDGDAQRIAQMVWIFFLKIYDAQEEDWECEIDNYKSIIPEKYRWRNWARSKDDDGKFRKDALTGNDLLEHVNTMFDVLKSLPVGADTPRGKAIVKEVFSEVNQYMKKGNLLREMINVIDDIDFTDTKERHMFGDIYETILKDLQGAGKAGEFYTPRAVTDFVIEMLDPRIGQTIGDFAMGTGGFLVSALNYLKPQMKSYEDIELLQNACIGQEWKPFPYLLGVTNFFLNGIKNPNLIHCDSLGKNIDDYTEAEQVDIIAMNPPYGGATDDKTKNHFPIEFRSSETTELFLVLIMARLKLNGKAGVIVSDGLLFGDGAAALIRQKLLKEFNLHTIIRLPGTVFSPYTDIPTNILFFDNSVAEDSPEGYCTKGTWFYRLDMPEGYKHFSKTNPMLGEHCQKVKEWWFNRTEIVDDEIGEKSRYFTPGDFEKNAFDFNQCKFQNDDIEIVSPKELLEGYTAIRNELNAEIADRLSEIQSIINDEPSDVSVFPKHNPWMALSELTKTLPERLHQSLLMDAIQGKLVKQDNSDDNVEELLSRIYEEKKILVASKKLKGTDLLSDKITEEDYPFVIPENWKFVRLKELCIFLSRGKSPTYSTISKEYPVFAQKCNLKEGGISLEKAQFLDPQTVNKWQEEYKLKDGDVLVNSTGTGTVCRTRLFNTSCLGNYPFVVPDSHVSVVRTSKEVLSEYIYFALNSRKMQLYMEDNLTGSTKQKELYIGALQNLIIPLPPYKEQVRIVEKLHQVLPKLGIKL